MHKAIHILYLGIFLTLQSTLSYAQIIHYTGSLEQSDSTFENLLFYDVAQNGNIHILDTENKDPYSPTLKVKQFDSKFNLINVVTLESSTLFGQAHARANPLGIKDFKIGSDRRIYLALSNKGLYVFSEIGKLIDLYNHDPKNPTENEWSNIRQIEFDNQWNLYILNDKQNQRYEICKLNSQLEFIEKFDLDAQSYNPSFAIDQDGVIYSNSTGYLYQYEPKENYESKIFSKSFNQSSQNLLIAIDNQKNIWIHQEGDSQIAQYDKEGNLYDEFKSEWPLMHNLDKVIFRGDSIYILNFEGQNSWERTKIMKFTILGSQPGRITGKRIVPLNSKVTYTAYPDIPGLYYYWSFTGSGLDPMGSDYNSDSYDTNIKSYYATNQMTAGWLICKIYSSSGYDDSAAIYIEPSLRKTPTTLAELTCQDNGYSNCSYGSIQSIQLNDLKNTNTECNDIGYWDFTTDTITGNLYQGQYYSAELELSKNANQEQYVGVWIDFNNNGDFNDPDEFIGTAISFNGKVKITNIKIPASSNYTGEVRMRLRARPLKAFEANEACMRTADIGETEDYTLKISESVGLSVPNAITPNQDGKNDYFVIKGITGNDNTLVITDSFGKAIYETKNYQNNWPEQSNKSKLPKGTYYYFYNSGSTSVNGFFVVNY
jgi:gliding motility-associated-like protein